MTARWPFSQQWLLNYRDVTKIKFNVTNKFGNFIELLIISIKGPECAEIMADRGLSEQSIPVNLIKLNDR